MANVRQKRPKLAVWKFASCDGCQLTLLDCEDEILELSTFVDIANFPEATRRMVKGPYDVSLVEGSVTTPHDFKRIREVREQSGVLITIGACATSGGVQALRNYASLEDYTRYVYANPQYISSLATSTPISQHVKVDFELQGCPIDKKQLIEVLTALLNHRKPNIPNHSECVDCKMKGNVCVLVAKGTLCLGPITHAGCGAICPSFGRGCYGCFGPKEAPNPVSLGNWFVDRLGKSREDVIRSLRSIHAGHDALKKAVEELSGRKKN